MFYSITSVNLVIIASFISVLFTFVFLISTSLIICLAEKGEQQ